MKRAALLEQSVEAPCPSTIGSPKTNAETERVTQVQEESDELKSC